MNSAPLAQPEVTLENEVVFPMPENEHGFFCYSAYDGLKVNIECLRQVMKDLVSSDTLIRSEDL